MEEPCIRVEKLTKSFAGRTVVDGLSFSVRKGQVFALLGHNGAGKSTTIDLILGLKSPDSGFAKILGVDAAKNRKKVFEQVGVQLQHSGELYRRHLERGRRKPVVVRNSGSHSEKDRILLKVAEMRTTKVPAHLSRNFIGGYYFLRLATRLVPLSARSNFKNCSGLS